MTPGLSTAGVMCLLYALCIITYDTSVRIYIHLSKSTNVVQLSCMYFVQQATMQDKFCRFCSGDVHTYVLITGVFYR